MNVEELSLLFDGISKGLGAALKEKEKKELAALVEMLRRFPNQSITDFVRFVGGSFSKEQTSVPALVEQIRAYKQGTGEPCQELFGILEKVAAGDLKKVMTALGMKPSNKKGENLKLLQAHLADGQANTTSSQSGNDLGREVEKAFSQYESIKANLRNITVEEMRARFATFSHLPKSVLAGLLSKLGYPAVGSREELEAKLLDNLTSIKISYDQTRQIIS